MSTSIDTLEQRSLTVVERARILTIRTAEDAERAAELARAIRELRAEAEAHHRPVIQAALEAHRRALDALKRIDEPLREAENLVKRALAEWTAEQERLRLEAERRAREEAERLRLEAIEAQIEAMESAGASPQEIQAAIAAAESSPVIAPRVPSPVRPSGVSTRRIYRAHVHSLIELVRWVAENPSHENLLEPNQSALNALARAQGTALSIPGVRVVVEDVVAVRR